MFCDPSLSNFCQKIIYFQFFEMRLTSLPPIWTMSLNILFFFRLPLRLGPFITKQQVTEDKRLSWVVRNVLIIHSNESYLYTGIIKMPPKSGFNNLFINLELIFSLVFLLLYKPQTDRTKHLQAGHLRSLILLHLWLGNYFSQCSCQPLR